VAVEVASSSATGRSSSVVPDAVAPEPAPTPAQLFDLTGRVALVTGGGTHLGAAMAGALAGAGAEVHLASRRRQVCAEVADRLSDSGARAFAHGCDISDPQAVRDLVDGVAAAGGRLDVLVANAGGSAVRGAFTDLDPADLRATMDVNVVGTASCAQAAARHMIRAGGGSIILIGSIHGALGSDRRAYGPEWVGSAADYHIAKGAVVNMARALAMEWSLSGVRVNCLSPGQMPKPTLPAAQAERFRSATPLGRLGVPQDLAGAVLLLASDAGSFITGQNLVVDGGWSAR
jgi:NAD(P)-dependent dehydrogenase (short-subunit alcohol dehydrogenase family)